MDAEFRRYLAGLKGEEPPASIRESRWEETQALARRLVTEGKVEAALRLIEQEPARRKRWDLLLLTALLRESLGEWSVAMESFEVVADKLMAAGDEAGVRLLLEKLLSPEPSSAAVRFLHFLAQRESNDSERIRLLEDAIAIRPGDSDLHAEIAAALERLGDTERAREHRVRWAELSLDAGRPERVGDDLLRILEDDLPSHPARVGRILLRFAALVPWIESEPLLDLGLPGLTKGAGGQLGWKDLAPVAARVPATPKARDLFGRYLRVVVAREPDPDAILAGSGALDPAQSIDAVGTRLPNILLLPPGAHVAHTTWGIGKVRSSDGENLTLEFPARQGHKMSFAMASRSLDRLSNDGLRVLAIQDGPKLTSLAQSGDPEVLVRALHDAGGTATQAQLKPRLEAALPGFDWSAFWKQVKEKVKSDRRLDASEAYRQIYRLAAEGSAPAQAVLPKLTPRGSSDGLALIRRMLKDHPDEESRLRDHALSFVKRWAADENLDPPVRAQALCYAVSWEGLNSHEGQLILEDLIHEGLSPDDLTLSANQDQLLDLSVGSRREDEFLWRAMESRLPRIRERGRKRLQEILGERYAKAIETRISRGIDAPVLATRLIEHFVAKPRDPGAPTPAILFLGTARLLERELPEGLADRLTALLADGSALRTSMQRHPLSEDDRSSVENLVLHWSGSELRITPLLDLLRSIGMGELADAFETRRRKRAESLLEGKSVDDLDTRFTIMSRQTYDRMEAELKRIALELKTTIPAAIEKARQLGDLRENAEYEAAKQKQANAATRLQELLTTLERTKLLDTIEIDASRVGAGTQAVLSPLDQGESELTYWILGEGDAGYAPNVLSYRAPLARPLLGRSVGTEVVLELPQGPRRYRVESIVKRLP